MIKATELRLLNYVLRDGHVAEVRAIIGEDNFALIDKERGIGTHRNDGHLEPIPLTEEWLERMGFVDITEGYRATGQASPVYRIASPVRGQDINLYQGWDYKNGKALGYFLAHFEYVMQYVHQLQNLFFALTGEELTIKEMV